MNYFSSQIPYPLFGIVDNPLSENQTELASETSLKCFGYVNMNAALKWIIPAF